MRPNTYGSGSVTLILSKNATLNIVALQVLSTRKRKDVAEADVKVQVCLFGFDLLYLNGESLVTRPFQVRSNKDVFR